MFSRMKNRTRLFLLFLPAILAPFWTATVRADPAAYPEYAQQTLPPGVKPEFIKVEALVNAIIDRQRPLIIDVRGAEEYREIHIKGSISVPLADLEKRLGEIPRDRPVVLY
jgi:hypothetical protein